MEFQAFYRLIQRNRDGEVVSDTGKRRSHSFVIQFLELLEGLGRSLDPQDATDVANAETTICESEDALAYYGRVDAGQGDDTHGIQVGLNTGATAEANTNYVIDTLIDHSDVGAAGDLNYQAVTFVAPVVDGANIDFDITRPFLNESGNPITIDEITLVCKNSVDTKYHLLLRDVGMSEAVADANTCTVVYTLRTTA
jgi:hypothetical protein